MMFPNIIPHPVKGVTKLKILIKCLNDLLSTCLPGRQADKRLQILQVEV